MARRNLKQEHKRKTHHKELLKAGQIRELEGLKVLKHSKQHHATRKASR